MRTFLRDVHARAAEHLAAEHKVGSLYVDCKHSGSFAYLISGCPPSRARYQSSSDTALARRRIRCTHCVPCTTGMPCAQVRRAAPFRRRGGRRPLRAARGPGWQWPHARRRTVRVQRQRCAASTATLAVCVHTRQTQDHAYCADVHVVLVRVWLDATLCSSQR